MNIEVCDAHKTHEIATLSLAAIELVKNTHKKTQKNIKKQAHRERRVKPEEEPFQEGVALQPRVQQRLRWSGGPRVLKLRQLLMHLLHRRSPFSPSDSTSNSSDNATAHCDMDDKPPKPKTLQILRAIRTKGWMRLSQQCRSLSLCPSVPASMLRVLRSRFEDDTVAQQQQCNQVCEMCGIRMSCSWRMSVLMK